MKLFILFSLLFYISQCAHAIKNDMTDVHYDKNLKEATKEDKPDTDFLSSKASRLSEPQENILSSRHRRHSKRETQRTKIRYIYYSEKEFEYSAKDSDSHPLIPSWIQILILYLIAIAVAVMAYAIRRFVVKYYIRKGNKNSFNRYMTIKRRHKQKTLSCKQTPTDMFIKKDVKDENKEAAKEVKEMGKDEDKNKGLTKEKPAKPKSSESDAIRNKISANHTINKVSKSNEKSPKKTNNQQNKEV